MHASRQARSRAQWVLLVLFACATVCPAFGRDLDSSEQKGGRRVRDAFREATGLAARSTVEIRDADGTRLGFGGVVDRRIVATKASGLKGEIFCITPSGGWLEVEVIARADEHDLALLRVPGLDVEPLELATDDIEVGRWVATLTPGRTRPVAVGIVSTGLLTVPHLWGGYGGKGGFLGIGIEPASKETLARLGVEGAVVVTSVADDSAAAKAGLRVGDIVLHIGGDPIADFESLARTISRFAPGDGVEVDIVRKDASLSVKATLGKRPDAPIGPGLVGPTSARKSGFPGVFQHDTWLGPDQMGGPIVDLHGRCVGINIARVDRTASFALPARTIREALSGLRVLKPGREGY